jgi:hypothetical protein
MGDYTGLRFTAPLNKTGRTVAALMTAPLFRAGDEVEWATWEDAQVKCPKLKLEEFLTFSRSHHIPRGALQFQPKGWGWANSYDPEAGTWTVCCSFKDTEEQAMAKVFIFQVLNKLINGVVTVEVRPPDALESQTYVLDGTPLGQGRPFGD